MNEGKIVINRNPEMPKDTSMQDARVAANAARDKLVNTPAAARPSEPATTTDGKVTEDLESVEVQLPNGTIVEFGPPSNISLTLKTVQLLGDQSNMLIAIYRILFSIRKVNGTTPAPITNTIEGEKLANMIGDDGLETLFMVSNEYWPAVKTKDLNLLKKNQRKF